MWKLTINFKDSFKAERSGIIYYGETKAQCINILAQLICDGEFDINEDSIFVGEDGMITGYTLGKLMMEIKLGMRLSFLLKKPMKTI